MKKRIALMVGVLGLSLTTLSAELETEAARIEECCSTLTKDFVTDTILATLTADNAESKDFFCRVLLRQEFDGLSCEEALELINDCNFTEQELLSLGESYQQEDNRNTQALERLFEQPPCSEALQQFTPDKGLMRTTSLPTQSPKRPSSLRKTFSVPNGPPRVRGGFGCTSVPVTIPLDSAYQFPHVPQQSKTISMGDLASLMSIDRRPSGEYRDSAATKAVITVFEPKPNGPYRGHKIIFD